MSCKNIQLLFFGPVTKVHVEVTDPNRLSTRAGGWSYWSIKELRCLLLHPPLTQLTSLLTNEKCWHLVKPLKNIVMTWSWPLQAIWPPAPIVQSWKPNENMSGQPPPLSFHGCSTKNSVVFISFFLWERPSQDFIHGSGKPLKVSFGICWCLSAITSPWPIPVLSHCARKTEQQLENLPIDFLQWKQKLRPSQTFQSLSSLHPS